VSRFAGRGVLVTGASRGLGRAIAEAFGREGARVGIGFRSRTAEAEQTLAAVVAAGGTGVLLPFDVRDAAAVDAAVRRFADPDGLDVLVNNAAVIHDQLFALMGREAWDEVVATTLTGTYLCCRAAVPLLLAKRRERS
jgi:3-oxoacyl-[acyl-carrier protein] reductase